MRSTDRPQSIPRPGPIERRAEIPVPYPVDLTAVEEFLQLLARLVRQLHTYPATSAKCVDAIAACHKALAARDGLDRIAFRVAPRELLVGEAPIGRGTLVEQELAARLYRARVRSVEIACTALPRHLARFCNDLIQLSEGRKSETTLADLLIEHGVDTIIADMVHQPEVFNLGAAPPPLFDLAARERGRGNAFIASGGPATHLYPPDRGWARLDPTSKLDSVSLVDLAVLVDSPAELAEMLMRLTGDEPAQPASSASPASALEQKFSEVTTLFSALDPRLARVMFAKLARVVLDLQPDRRTALLQRVILPGLLDGNVDGTVLKDFPDVNLAESLCLLLDLETAAPEVLSAALDRLELPDERKQAVVPMLESHLQARESTDASKKVGSGESSVDRHVRKLLRVDTAGGKSFADFMAFDFSIDNQATAAFVRMRDEIRGSDLRATELECLLKLMGLEPNPSQIERLLVRTSALLAELERTARWQDLAFWIVRHRQLGERLSSQRPDVTAAIASALERLCTPARARKLVELHQAGGESHSAAGALVEAFGVGLVPTVIGLLDNSDAHLAGPLGDLMSEHAQALAPELMARVGESGVASGRVIARVLGLAGPGYESAMARLLSRPDEQTHREAFRALAAIGTSHAATIVAGRIQAGAASMQAAAEEVLWHFPPALARTKLRELLGQRDFVVRNPALAARLLERAAQAQMGGEGLEPVLKTLALLRFRFWNRPLVRVARAAQVLLK